MRKATMANGKPAIIIYGIALSNSELAKIDENDEMWAMECEIVAVKKFKPRPANRGNYSPEDFLSNVGGIQHLTEWVEDGLTREQHNAKYSR